VAIWGGALKMYSAARARASLPRVAKWRSVSASVGTDFRSGTETGFQVGPDNSLDVVSGCPGTDHVRKPGSLAREWPSFSTSPPLKGSEMTSAHRSAQEPKTRRTIGVLRNLKPFRTVAPRYDSTSAIKRPRLASRITSYRRDEERGAPDTGR
jgi:hypothetical protein